jgi:hypothetical protein
MSIEVKTKTTGFGSPAETYVDKRLDLNDLIPNNQRQLGIFKGSENEIEKTNVDHQKWLTRREFLSKEFTTSWDDIPLAF